ncbi:ribbon-helix-helix protein, CopG family [Glycomyces harbinensis]|uniref:Ribbon-helix-helix protein, copG family n=1 Tax=Glycomyces harbinensis TaxID=58114 RepID=A0A1G7BQI1_9ACTN|nr:ribbon-helix-helix protein, CopG family [Glycomyces harbinensis]SDE29237.1 Ribbon-helix-helix protein, copG family [Glycomyces harbinensis]
MARTLRLSDEVERKFQEAAAEAGLSMNSAAELAIAEWIERRQRSHVRSTAEGIAKRHAGLMARLSE